MNEKELTYIFTKYIHKTLVNHAGKYYKKKFRDSHGIPYEETLLDYMIQRSLEMGQQKKLNPEEVFEKRIRYEKLNCELYNLSKEELSFLYMKFFLKKSDREIGRLMGISSQAISKRKRILIQKIQKNI